MAVLLQYRHILKDAVRISTVPYVLYSEFIPENELQTLIDFGSDNMVRLSETNPNPYFSGMTLVRNKIDEPEVRKIADQIVERTKNLIRSCFDFPNVFNDLSSINVWRTGTELGIHADNVYWETGKPNYTYWRKFGTVLYLNEDYTGGEFCWWDVTGDEPVCIEERKMKAGDLLVFGAGIEYAHSVSRVQSGIRWTFPAWYTDDVSRALDKSSVV